MHRCNLTAILLPNYADIPELLAAERVEIVASLPYYQARETDAQRGEGVFEESLVGLGRLNALGYGRTTGLVLNLVTNPVGTFLPGDRKSTRLNSSHTVISYAVFCLKKKKTEKKVKWIKYIVVAHDVSKGLHGKRCNGTNQTRHRGTCRAVERAQEVASTQIEMQAQ